jgi:polysaccharide export outer membrane protein
MRTAHQYRIAAVLLAALGSLMISRPSRADDNPPKELLRYVQDAKQRGVTESKIREQARSLGWPVASVDKAIAGDTTEMRAERDDGPAGAGGSRAKPASSGPASAATSVPDARLPGTVENRGVGDDYQIGPGDTLQVAVWKEPDVTVPSVVVRPDGRITVPLIKEVEVAGLTPRQAEKLITDGLSTFIRDANVTVVVSAINSKKVYVVGAVRKEGALPYTYGITVMQALSEVGGLTDYAKRKRIYVLRTELGRDYRLDFNYDEVVRGERMQQNIVLLPGDTVVIPH